MSCSSSSDDIVARYLRVGLSFAADRSEYSVSRVDYRTVDTLKPSKVSIYRESLIVKGKRDGIVRPRGRERFCF